MSGCENDVSRLPALVQRHHVEYYQRIREVVSGSKDPDRVVLMNLQLVPLQASVRAAP
jgi:hypothetical protein